VLWDDDGPTGLWVSKKTSWERHQKVKSRHSLYADALEKKKHGTPAVMYYLSNWIWEIYLWDDQNFINRQDRYTDLYQARTTRPWCFRRPSERHYVQKANAYEHIRDGFSIAKSIKKYLRKTLCWKWNGDGKFNREPIEVLFCFCHRKQERQVTSIASPKLMLECNWAKRIFFLADRIKPKWNMAKEKLCKFFAPTR